MSEKPETRSLQSDSKKGEIRHFAFFALMFEFLVAIGELLTVCCVVLLVSSSAHGEELPPKVKDACDRGLKWIADTQHRDGHWEANGNQYPVSMTALSGMSLLMEGSTLREGKYADHLRRATDWLMDRARPNGMIGNPENETERQRYMYGHGFGMLFLASVYGEEEDGDRRKKLEKILIKAVEFTGKAQTSKGGWGYVSAADASDFDEGSVTITQLQSIRAAKNAGIIVPKSIIDKAVKYLKDSTTANGGVVYSLYNSSAAVGGERPPLTAAAIACSFSAGDYNSDLAKKWLKYCSTNIPVGRGRIGHDEYLHYYYAQAIYILGDEGYGKLFPQDAKDRALTWSRYRKDMFDHILTSQNRDGSWSGGYIGPVFTTSVYLTILQLDKGMLPIYQR
ncbi:MAG: prenyltransferase/squalene oxidase repeat-containing protein [Gemmataceae bacterium]